MRNHNNNSRDKYIGKEYLSKDGKVMRVIEYIDNSHVVVEFIESGYKMTTSMDRIKSGKVNSPFTKSVVAFDTKEQERVGSKFNINGEIVEIIAVNSDGTLRYKIHDWYGYEGNTTYGYLKSGRGICNPYRLNRGGCYYGEPRFYRDQKYNDFLSHRWHAVIDRAVGLNQTYNYSSRRSIKKTLDSRLSKVWQNFQNFAEWFDYSIKELNIISLEELRNYEVDKDLLYPFYRAQSNNLKVYSPLTCELLPTDLNDAIYDPRVTRGDIIRKNIITLGNKYYSEGKISQRAYNAIQIIYNGNTNLSINIDIITPGYNEFIPRVDNFPQFYEDVLLP
jgi:hypothetical protein